MDLKYHKVLDPKLFDTLIPVALSLATRVRTDKLDCTKSFRRVPADESVQDIIDLLIESFRVDLRLIYRESNRLFELSIERYKPGGVAYFVWIDLTVEDTRKLIKDFNLPPIC